MIPIINAENARDVADLLDGTEKLISLVPLTRLERFLKWLKAAIFDFDGTLANGMQWVAVGELMRPELRNRDKANRDWYWSAQRSGNGTCGVSLDDPNWWIGHLHTGNVPVVDGAWIADAISLLQRSSVTIGQIEDKTSCAKPREGAIELLRMFETRAVISMGIEQFIVRWLLNHDAPSPVAATRLICDAQGVVDGCHLNVLGSESKKYAAERFREITRIRDEQVMVVGDSIVDIPMMKPSGFNVLLAPLSETNKQHDNFRKANFLAALENVTVVLASDSLQPLVDLIKRHRNGSKDA